MTFDDDFVRIPGDVDLGEFNYLVKLTSLDHRSPYQNITCRSLGFEWPPPERLFLGGVRLDQVSRSEITDGERALMTRVCRGAEYAKSAKGWRP